MKLVLTRSVGAQYRGLATPSKIAAGRVEKPCSPDLKSSNEHAHGETDGETRVQHTPHVSNRLLMSGANTVYVAANTSVLAADIALAHWSVDHLGPKVAIEREETLEEHVHVLSNRSVVGVPAVDFLQQCQRERIDRRRYADSGMLTHGRNAGSIPENVCTADK